MASDTNLSALNDYLFTETEHVSTKTAIAKKSSSELIKFLEVIDKRIYNPVRTKDVRTKNIESYLWQKYIENDLTDSSVIEILTKLHSFYFIGTEEIFNAIDEKPPTLALSMKLWNDYDLAEDDSLEKRKAEGRLGKYYLLKLAFASMSAKGDYGAVVAESFSELSKLIYGDINFKTAKQLIALQSQNLKIEKNDKELLKEIYGQKSKVGSLSLLSDKKRNEVLKVLKKLFPEIFTVIEKQQAKSFTAKKVQKIFKEILELLAKNNSDWQDWRVVDDLTKSQISVRSFDKEIVVPSSRRSIKSKEKLLGLALHEIGVHATRSVNGEKLGHDQAYGLPDYMKFEEGLGTFFEYCISGKVPTKIIDRYVDIALALGANGRMYSKYELYELTVSREEKRFENKSVKITPYRHVNIQSKAAEHVGRIFRGGSGQIHQLGDKSVQGIFVKDAVYFNGFISAVDYVNNIYNKKTIEDDLQFLLSAKFDPNDVQHLKLV